MTTTFTPTVQQEINESYPGRVDDALRSLGLGDVLALLLAAATPTEAAAAVTSNAKTLAHPAAYLFDVVATAGTLTGRLQLLIGGPTVLPATGQCVWDGASSVRFAAVDAITAANFLYSRSDVPPTVSALARVVGQQDPVV